MIPTDFEDTQICIVGLGYVGLTLAVALANCGFRVHGVETNQVVLDSLKEGKAHFWEVNLDRNLAEHLQNGQITFSREIDPAFTATVYIVTVGTPISEDKRTKSEGLIAVTNAIAAVLKSGDLVILRSTVKVGTTRNIVAPILNRCGVAYDLAFCPERTLEGKALLELSTLPQIVGGLNYRSTFRASQVFSFLTPSVVRVHDPETAEMVKLVNNTQRDFVFAFANEVAAMCDALGISAVEVIRSGNLGYPRAGLPFPGPVGGPCLEKDPYILAEGLEQTGFIPKLSIAARRWNEELPDRVVANISKRFQDRKPYQIAVVGVAFKGQPATDDLRGSLAIPLVDRLRSAYPDVNFVGWDPIVKADAIAEIGLSPTKSLEAAFENSDVVVIQNNHEIFSRADMASLSCRLSAGGLIYDLWNLHDPRQLSLAENTSYLALGALDLYNTVREERNEA